jgi:A/G-specific adenine glycosylase
MVGEAREALYLYHGGQRVSPGFFAWAGLSVAGGRKEISQPPPGEKGTPTDLLMTIRVPRHREIMGFRRRLRTWYRIHGRHDLPWRGAFDPYHVLVSELMLQQTTVSTVIPYFHRFINLFPTLRHLSRAPLESVLKQWAGLGYYARARHLHRAAQVLVRDHQATVPATRALVEGLPGVGPYTAGALLSFAHDLPEALVDGNVIRLLSRMYGVKGDTRRPEVTKKMWTIARALVPAKGARHYNSALMDFGSLVCKPGLPDCPICPLSSLCWAQRNGWVDRLPESRREKAKTLVRLNAFLIEKEGRLLFHRRALGGLWGGLWELPMVEGPLNEQTPVPVAGGAVHLLRRLGTFRHILSHRDLRVTLWKARQSRPLSGTRWVLPKTAPTMAISALTSKLIRGRI